MSKNRITAGQKNGLYLRLGGLADSTLGFKRNGKFILPVDFCVALSF